MNYYDYTHYGRTVTHFRQARRFVLNSAQAAGPLWEFRWGDTTAPGSVAVVNRVTLKAIQTANATAEELRFNLRIARGFTVADTTNVASIKRTGNMQKLHANQRDSLLTDFLEANSATAPTGGTYTQDTDPIVSGSFVTIAAVSTTSPSWVTNIFDFSGLADGELPLVSRVNEGWVINLEAAKGATTGVSMFVEVSWSEIQPMTDV